MQVARCVIKELSIFVFEICKITKFNLETELKNFSNLEPKLTQAFKTEI